MVNQISDKEICPEEHSERRTSFNKWHRPARHRQALACANLNATAIPAS